MLNSAAANSMFQYRIPQTTEEEKVVPEEEQKQKEEEGKWSRLVTIVYPQIKSISSPIGTSQLTGSMTWDSRRRSSGAFMGMVSTSLPPSNRKESSLSSRVTIPSLR